MASSMSGQTALALVMLLALQAPLALAQPRFGPSSSAPGGLSPSKTPLFLLFTHDDQVTSSSSKLVRSITDKYSNPNGCKMPVTWFTLSKGSSCSAILDLYERGHELAGHTKTHISLRKLTSYSKVKDEIKGSRDEIVACGIPKGAVAGFRMPFLEDSELARRVLYNTGFRYDSTLAVHGGRNHLWPATMERFSPFDCGVGGNKCKKCSSGSSKCEAYPGMWEVPLVETDSYNLMDYCMDEDNFGSDKNNCDAYDKLMGNFKDSLASNRAPITIGIHSYYLEESKYKKAVDRFLEKALATKVDGRKVVWAVTMSQLLDWMESPVPVDKMAVFMSKYKCDK